MPAETDRTVIWIGPAERLTLIEYDDGSLALMRSSDVDDAGARSCPIPAAALGTAHNALFAKSLQRACAAVGANLRAAIAEMREVSRRG